MTTTDPATEGDFPMTQIDLDRLRELRARGTQGELAIEACDEHDDCFHVTASSADFAMHCDLVDADLIVAAVNAVGPLANEIGRLRAACLRWENSMKDGESTDLETWLERFNENMDATRAALEEKGGEK